MRQSGGAASQDPEGRQVTLVIIMIVCHLMMTMLILMIMMMCILMMMKIYTHFWSNQGVSAVTREQNLE